MRKAIGAVLAVVMCSGLACSSGSKDERTLPETGGSGGGGAVIVGGTKGERCTAGTPCPCPGGLLGRNECVDDLDRCDCTGCEGEPPQERPSAFDACGGELFGTWRLTDVDLSSTHLYLAVDHPLSGTQEMTACPTNARLDESIDGPADVLLSFESGGMGIGKMSGLFVDVEISPDCPAQIGKDCGDFKLSAGACGLCAASSSLGYEPAAETRWELMDGNWVLVSFSGSDGVGFYYCVDGDKLSLQNTSNELELQLERVYPIGVPRPCDERPLESCENPSEASDDGCRWDTTVCTGEAAYRCGADDFGVVPGCVLSDAPAVCVGSPSPCSAIAVDDCPSHPGCSIQPSCSGTGEECRDFYDTPEECPAGCTCEDIDGSCYCSGQSDCSAATNLATCETADSECKWAFYCRGEIDCTKLKPDECQLFEGCELAAP